MNKLFLIKEDKNTDYLDTNINKNYANFIKLIKNTSNSRLFKTFSRLYHQAKLFLLTRLRDVFNTFLGCTGKAVIYKRICLGHTYEKFMVSVQNLKECKNFSSFSFSLYYTF